MSFPSPTDPHVEADRAARAKRLLEDPLFVEARETVKAGLLDAWLSSPVRDTEGRERLFLMLRMLDTAFVHLTSVMETGELAKHGMGPRAV